MSEPLTLLGLMGVPSLAAAAAKWPRKTFVPGLDDTGNDPADFEPLLGYLNAVLRFTAVRPGAAADRVGLSAEVTVAAHPSPEPLVLRQLPNFVFLLRPTPRPARLFVTRSDAGAEILVEGLPVEIQLPTALLSPLRSEEEELRGPGLVDVKQAGPFEPGIYDTFEVVLRDVAPSSLLVHVRVRFTEEQEVVIEPAVPIAIGPCRFSGVPCDGVHDLGFLPYPKLTGPHTQHELPLEWTRHEIPAAPGGGASGMITVRTVDLDHTREPVRSIISRIDDDTAASGLEFVLEDLALPVSSWRVPIPMHGRFGLRRAVLQGGDDAEPYDFSLAPVEVNLDAIVKWRLKIFRLLFETPATVNARMAVLLGDSEQEDHALVIDVTDGWLLQGAWLPPNPLHCLTLANAKVSLLTVKLGILLRDLLDAQGTVGVLRHFRLLGDFGIKIGDGKKETVQLCVSGQPPGADLGQDLVVRDLGWNLGERWPLLPTVWFPEALKLTAFEVVQLQVEEFAFLSEDNGGRYVAFSGGISIFPGAGQPKRTTTAPGTPGVPAESQPPGGGLRFRRLRLRVSGNEQAPRLLLDGISLFIKKGPFELSGSGSITDVTRAGHRFRESASACWCGARC